MNLFAPSDRGIIGIPQVQYYITHSCIAQVEVILLKFQSRFNKVLPLLDEVRTVIMGSLIHKVT